MEWDKSLYHLFIRAEAVYADRPAMRWYDEERQTVCIRSYADFFADIRRMMAVLREKTGDPVQKHIVILSGNSYAAVVAMMAVLGSGSVAVPLNDRETPDILQTAIAETDAELILSDPAHLALMRERYGDSVLSLSCYEGVREPADFRPFDDPERTVCLLGTSGTVSGRKFVELSERNIMTVLRYEEDKIRRGSAMSQAECRSVVWTLPLYHISGLAQVLVVQLYFGVCESICANPRRIDRDSTLAECDSTLTVPALLEMWKKQLTAGMRCGAQSMRFIIYCGSSLSAECRDFYLERGVPLCVIYGLTESSGVGTGGYLNDMHRPDSIGRAAEGTEVKVIDGELCIKGPGVMKGYYKRPGETAEVLQDGWLHTGDLGHIDEDGFVYLTGRKKNLIILSNGENVIPEELETILQREKAIREVIVKEKNDSICAEIYADPQDQEHIRAYVRTVNRELPLFKHIAGIEFREEPFPRTASGKIRRGAAQDV